VKSLSLIGGLWRGIASDGAGHWHYLNTVMEPQPSLASEFAALRLPNRLQQATDRLRLRPPHPAMDQLVQDFNTALDETAGSGSARSGVSRRKAWKRRCKSTSNLLQLAGQNVSDDSSSSVDNVGLLSRDRGTSSLQFSDSDLEQGGPAGPQGKPGRSRHARLHEYRTKREGAGAELPGVESDSFNENISPFKEFRANSKRKRKFKRMAVDESPENRKPRVTQTPGSKKKKVRSRSGHHEPGRKGHAVTPGKRKRSAREKSVESGEVLSSGRSRTVSLGEEGAAGLERMEMEEGGCSSSLSSSSDWEAEHSDGREEGEADDEHSDWPGPEPGLSVMQLTDEEIDPEISFSQLLAGPPSRKSLGRPVRSGTRRLKSQAAAGGSGMGAHPVVLAYSEQVSRFIEDSGRTSLRLPAVRASDRNMILNLASLYSLSWCPEGPSVLLLTKTGQTVKPEFAVPGIPPASGSRSGQLRERKSTDIKRQRRTPPLSLMGASTSAMPGKSERQNSGSKSRHRPGSGSKSS